MALYNSVDQKKHRSLYIFQTEEIEYRDWLYMSGNAERIKVDVIYKLGVTERRYYIWLHLDFFSSLMFLNAIYQWFSSDDLDRYSTFWLSISVNIFPLTWRRMISSLFIEFLGHIGILSTPNDHDSENAAIILETKFWSEFCLLCWKIWPLNFPPVLMSFFCQKPRKE